MTAAAGQRRRAALAAVVAAAAVVVLLCAPSGVRAQCQDGTPSNTTYATRYYGTSSTDVYATGSTTPQPTNPSAANERNYQDQPWFYSSYECCPGSFYSCMPTFPALYPTGAKSPMFPYNTANDVLFPRNDDGFRYVSLNNLGDLGKNYRIKFYGRT